MARSQLARIKIKKAKKRVLQKRVIKLIKEQVTRNHLSPKREAILLLVRMIIF